MKMSHALFTVILLEGFIVLAVELLAIRQLLPFVGSSTDVVAIVIAAVLMPLSFGYYAGGNFKMKRLAKHGKTQTIRQKLLANMLVASVFFLGAVSYPLLVLFFEFLKAMGVEGERLKTAIFAGLFLVYPVFLMGQTIPLVTNYFKYHKLSDITGRVLFFSTLGSFGGSIVSTIVLMATIGVHNTVIVIFGLVLAIVVLLSRQLKTRTVFYAIVLFVLAALLNNNDVMKAFKVVSNNQYSIIKVFVDEEKQLVDLNINHSNSARMAQNYESMFDYLQFMENMFIKPVVEDDNLPAMDILILGAGGFTMGYGDTKNAYSYVDVDRDLLEIAETYLLENPLEENKKFYPQGARAFLSETQKKFDLIVVDLYSNDISIPSHLITQEFYQSVKRHLKPGGIVTMNIIAKPYFGDDFSLNIDETIRSVFFPVNRHLVHGYSPWKNKDAEVNLVYVYVDNKPSPRQVKIYTDNLNTYYLDKD
ncbi:MAG: hypothetical protein CMF60_01175 [Magnetococcales bacterium]|nr:hypothetical protein [Magnetococcales bacterium]|tara:strand:- start:8380 stop:9807 length:1428 start_codon:yes stop_codon:yes gene_type:complete